MRLSVAASLLCLLSPLLRAQQPATQTPAAPSADGIWLGTLHAGKENLRIQVHLKTASGSCTLDSIDQKAFAIPCTILKSPSDRVSLDVPAVGGLFTGKLSADGKTITGVWTQDGSADLILERQTTAIAPPVEPLPTFDAAMPPVPLADLKSVLDRDLAAALATGDLAPATHTGVTIGVVEHGVRRIFAYGTAQPDSVYEIGSISKTFTALILAQMVEQHKVSLDEPVRELLPPGTVAKPAGQEITLLDLSDQHSGLPRMPDNFHPADPNNPYADYNPNLLYAFIAKQGVALPGNAEFLYSNLGVGLLGQALSDRAGVPYLQLLHDEVTGPLGMTDTVVTLTPALSSRFIQGYDEMHNAVHAWDLDALAGAGGIRSTAADMLTYLEAQLHPDKLPASVAASANGKTISAAIRDTHQIHAVVDERSHIALNWFHIDKSGDFWHNGETGGYSSYAIFNPEKDFAVVVLCNTTADEFADNLGVHIVQRLFGEPAVSLAPNPQAH